MWTIYLPMRRLGTSQARVLAEWIGILLYVVFGRVVLGGDGVNPSGLMQRSLCVAAALVAGAALLAPGGIIEPARRLAAAEGARERTIAVLWILWHLVALAVLAWGFFQMAAPAWCIGSGLYGSDI